MIRKIESISILVKKILMQYPDTRDSDRLLILKVWSHQNNHLRNRTYTFYSFALDFLNGHYADTESIRRSRQKIQELNPGLRGKGYLKRKDIQRTVQSEIKFLDPWMWYFYQYSCMGKLSVICYFPLLNWWWINISIIPRILTGGCL